MKWECNCCESEAGDMNGCIIEVKHLDKTCDGPPSCPWSDAEPHYEPHWLPIGGQDHEDNTSNEKRLA